MEVTVLEAIGTIGAGGGGLVGLYLLGRGLWRMWSGQLEEQRKLLGDVREGRLEVIKERDALKDQITQIENRCAELEQTLRNNTENVRQALQAERVKRRQWAEYGSELRRLMIENGIPVSEMPPFPSKESVNQG